MFRYTFTCRKCGYHQECATKADWLLAKKGHKTDRCNLTFYPDIENRRFILSRRELSEDMRRKLNEADQNVNPTDAIAQANSTPNPIIEEKQEIADEKHPSDG